MAEVVKNKRCEAGWMKFMSFGGSQVEVLRKVNRLLRRRVDMQ